MPLSIQVTQGLLTPEGERKVLPRMAAALLKAHGLTGNAFMTPNVVGHLSIYPQEHCYVGEISQSLAVIEVKVPSVTFMDQAISDAFVAEATEIIHAYRAGAHPKERTFVNVVHAVDGAWGIGGKAFTNAAIGEAIQAAAM